MKNIVAALLLGTALANVTFAQTLPNGSAGKADKVKVAVVEFTPGSNVPLTDANAKRQLQASTAFKLMQTKRFHVVDVRHTRDASQADLAAINGLSTAGAVRVGKQLKVSYVLTGTVDKYDPKGSATLKTRLVEVATGKVKRTDEISQDSNREMLTGSDVEMKTRVLLPLLDKLAEALAAETF